MSKMEYTVYCNHNKRRWNNNLQSGLENIRYLIRAQSKTPAYVDTFIIFFYKRTYIK